MTTTKEPASSIEARLRSPPAPRKRGIANAGEPGIFFHAQTPFVVYFIRVCVLGYPSPIDLQFPSYGELLLFFITGFIDYVLILTFTAIIFTLTFRLQSVEESLLFLSFLFRARLVGWSTLRKVCTVDVARWEEVQKLSLVVLKLSPSLFWHAIFAILGVSFPIHRLRSWAVASLLALVTGDLNLDPKFGWPQKDNATDYSASWLAVGWGGIKRATPIALIYTIARFSPMIMLFVLAIFESYVPSIARWIEGRLDSVRVSEAARKLLWVDSAISRKRDAILKTVIKLTQQRWNFVLAKIFGPALALTEDALNINAASTRRFRLLRVHPGYFQDRISCTRHWHNLDSAPSYSAISYHWGDSAPCSGIDLDGVHTKITKSAMAALKGLRSNWRTKTFWIDAICIDQQNKLEMEQQLPLMADIYRNAKHVIVWLGPAKDGDLALDVIRKLWIRGALSQEFKARLDSSDIPDPVWEALTNMLHQPWFERTWVVQEVVVPRRVIVRYGDASLDWRTVSWFIRFVVKDLGASRSLSQYTIGPVATRHLQTIEEFRSLYKGSGKNLSLLFHLVRMFRSTCSFRTTKQKDKIYALVNIGEEAGKEHFVPDISQTDAELYTSVARYFLTQGRLEMLAHSGAGSGRITSDLPSWVPDWSADPISLPFIGLDGTSELLGHPRLEFFLHEIANMRSYGDIGYRDSAMHNEEVQRLTRLAGDMARVTYHSTRESVPVIQLYPGNKIEVQGISVSRIMHTGPQFRSIGIFKQLQEGRETLWNPNNGIPREWRDLAMRDSEDPYSPGTSRLDAFCRTLVGDLSQTWFDFTDKKAPVRPLTTDLQNLVNAYEYFGRCMLDQGNRTAMFEELDANPIHSAREQLEHLERIIHTICMGRVFGVADSGYMGLFPHGTQPGDIICLLNGADVPFVLREVVRKTLDEHSNRPVYELLGPCYVHGIMDGEFLDSQPKPCHFLIQ